MERHIFNLNIKIKFNDKFNRFEYFQLPLNFMMYHLNNRLLIYSELKKCFIYDFISKC